MTKNLIFCPILKSQCECFLQRNFLKLAIALVLPRLNPIKKKFNFVKFSIENRKALNAREKRQQKSVEKNPTLNGNKKAVNDSTTLAMKNVKLNTGKVRSGCPHIGALNFQIVRFWGHPINSHV